MAVKTVRESIDLPEGQSFRLLRWSRNLREVDSVLANGEARRISGEGVHWHRHLEMELTLFTSGDGTRFVGDHIGGFAAGDLVLLGTNLPHHWHTRGESSGVSMQWHFPPEHPFWAFPENLPLLAAFRRAERGLRITGPAARLIAELMLELAAARGPARLAALLEVLARVAEVPARAARPLSSRSFGLSSGTRHQKAIAAALRHLIANFRDEVRLDEVLQIAGMSRPTFARQFKQHAGRTFSEFVNRLRLQAACRALLESDRGVLEISLECGFNQISFFNRLFRREFGCSPRDYRNGTGRVDTKKRPAVERRDA